MFKGFAKSHYFDPKIGRKGAVQLFIEVNWPVPSILIGSWDGISAANPHFEEFACYLLRNHFQTILGTTHCKMICLLYCATNAEESLGFFMTRNLLPSAFGACRRILIPLANWNIFLGKPLISMTSLKAKLYYLNDLRGYGGHGSHLYITYHK